MAWNPPKPVRYLLQVFNFAVFMALVWYFSAAPAVRLLGPNEAVLTIAFAHAGQLREPCRRLTQEELNQLAPNMRALEDCPRERSPVTILAELDGEPVYEASLPPPGLFGDGGVDVFYSAKIPAGEHVLTLRMNDSVRIEGFNHELERRVNVEPAQVLLVGFDTKRGFVFHDIDGQDPDLFFILYGSGGGRVKVLADTSGHCIEDQPVIDQILNHLNRKGTWFTPMSLIPEGTGPPAAQLF